MANIAAITGIRTVIQNLKRNRDQMSAGLSRGLRKAGLKLQRESQKVVPVNFGILKNSAFTRAEGQGFGMAVIVGYTARYAIYVHEAVGMKLKGTARTQGDSAYFAAVDEAMRIGVRPPRPKKGYQGRYWDPQGRGQAKFLEEPARRLAPELRQIIRDEMRIR